MFKRHTAILLFSLVIVSTQLYGIEAGTGFSVFLPESLYKEESGSVSLETRLSTSFGLGDYIEVPFGFVYNKVQGYTVEGLKAGGTEIEASSEWFMGDLFLPFIALQGNLPLGPLEVSLFIGGAMGWNASLSPFKAAIARDLAADNEYALFTSFDYSNHLTLGVLAGASLGVSIDALTFSISAEYRSLSGDIDLEGSYETGPSGSISTTGSIDGSDAKLVIRGISLGIAGSFSF